MDGLRKDTMNWGESEITTLNYPFTYTITRTVKLRIQYGSYLRNKTSVPVFYRRIKYKYEFRCV